MVGQQPDDIVSTDPDLTVAFLLTFVKDQLDAKVQVDRFNVVDIFFVGIAGAAHESDELSGLHLISHFQSLRKGVILL